MLQGGVHAHDLRVRLGVDETGMAIAGRAANAVTLPWILLVEHDTDRNMERLIAELPQVVAEGLDARLVADGREAIGRTGGRVRGINTPLPVDVIEILRLSVVRLHVRVRKRPRRGDAAVVADRTEVLLPHPQQRCAVEFG